MGERVVFGIANAQVRTAKSQPLASLATQGAYEIFT